METPPILAQFPEAPIYELAFIAEKVGVRPITLWAWEQQLGIASGERPVQDPSTHKRRYSERDLIALLWLRDRIIVGDSPQEASARLLAAQRASGASGALGPMTTYGGTEALAGVSGVSGALGFSGPLGSSQAGFQRTGADWLPQPNVPQPATSPGLNGERPPRNPAAQPGSLGSGQAGPLDPPLTPTTPGLDGYPAGPNASPWPPALTGALGARTTSGALAGGPAAGNEADWPGAAASQREQWTPDPWPPRTDLPATSAPSTSSALGITSVRPAFGGRQPYAGPPPQVGGRSGRLGTAFGLSQLPTSSLALPSYGQPARDLRELRPLVTHLLQAFARFDTRRADTTILEALNGWGVEATVQGLVHPSVTRISDLWSKSELTAPEEQFGLNYLRGLLFSIFHATTEAENAPFAVIACAPKETNDFGALTLAVFWRRANLRVAYLGQDVNEEELLRERWPVTPAVVVLTASSSQRIRAMARIGKRLHEMPSPEPIFAYTGPAFTHNADLQRKLGGVYLGDDAAVATRYIRKVLHLDW